MIKFSVTSRFTGTIQFTAEIDCADNEPTSVKLGLAVKWGIKTRANLTRANLDGANLDGANLYGANLYGANLTRANLDGANLYGANLYGANLYGANLYGANLTRANLDGANLDGANLTRANLDGAKCVPLLAQAQTSIIADGDIIGWKKLAGGTICKLRIPASARRSNATGRKCRAESAEVLEGDGRSVFDASFKYVVGETVRPREPFGENRWEECASGIHFFITRAEAESYRT